MREGKFYFDCLKRDKKWELKFASLKTSLLKTDLNTLLVKEDNLGLVYCQASGNLSKFKRRKQCHKHAVLSLKSKNEEESRYNFSFHSNHSKLTCRRISPKLCKFEMLIISRFTNILLILN